MVTLTICSVTMHSGETGSAKVYVDITMKAAKENDLTVEQHSRESIRIARIARELLKKFAAAFRLFQDMDEGVERGKGLKIAHSHNFMDGDMLESIAITKELFLMVIQDRRVQGLMDELELPPDRANLFEIIDADGSGTLQLSELAPSSNHSESVILRN